MFKDKRTVMVGTLVVALFLSLLTLLAPGKVLAAEYKSFINIPNIPGESTDGAHPRWIDVISWSFGETKPSTTVGATRATMQDLKFTMRTNAASPKLFLAGARPERLQEATLEVCRSDLQGNPRFLRIKINDVIVSSFETLVNSGSTDLLEKVSLNFGKIEIAYTPFDTVSGAAGTTVTVGWDLRTNLGVGSLPTSPASIYPTRVGAGVVAAGKTLPGQTSPPAICFIKVGGFLGESTDRTHKDWIDVITSGFGETQPTTYSSGMPVQSNIQDFKFTMRTSKASPLLFLAGAMGQHIPEAMLEVYRPGVDTGDANLRITLSDVVISSFLSLGSTTSYPMEEILLKFTKIKIQYTGPAGSTVEYQVSTTR